MRPPSACSPPLYPHDSPWTVSDSIGAVGSCTSACLSPGSASPYVRRDRLLPSPRINISASRPAERQASWPTITSHRLHQRSAGIRQEHTQSDRDPTLSQSESLWSPTRRRIPKPAGLLATHGRPPLLPSICAKRHLASVGPPGSLFLEQRPIRLVPAAPVHQQNSRRGRQQHSSRAPSPTGLDS